MIPIAPCWVEFCVFCIDPRPHVWRHHRPQFVNSLSCVHFAALFAFAFDLAFASDAALPLAAHSGSFEAQLPFKNSTPQPQAHGATFGHEPPKFRAGFRSPAG